MSQTSTANNNFGELKNTRFTGGDTPYMVWRETHDIPNTVTDNRASEVDVLEHLRFNIDQLQDLNSRFQFLLEELSSVLVKKK